MARTAELLRSFRQTARFLLKVHQLEDNIGARVQSFFDKNVEGFEGGPRSG